MSISSIYNQGYTNLANWADIIGTKYNLPELNLSEGLVKMAHASEPTNPLPTTYKGVVVENSGSGGAGGGGGAGYEPLTSNVPRTTTNPVVINPQPQQQTGGIPGVDMSFYQGWTDQNAINADWAKTWQSKLGQGGGSISGGGEDPYAGLRNEISSGYDAYLQSLNDTLNNDLPGQRTNMEGIIGNQYNMGVGDLNTQQAMGLSDLGAESTAIDANQAKNLKDLSENVRNMFMSGNVYLGSRGAGDSSAANQYAYALTKQGNKSRGDVMSQTAALKAEIGRRTTNLKQTVQNEINKLGQERDNKVLEVSNWFMQQQQAIKDRIGEVGLNKSSDLINLKTTLLDQAMTRLQQVEQDNRAKQTMLQEWALNNSNSIAALQKNLAGISAYNPTLPQAQTFSGTPTVSGGNYNMPIKFSQNLAREEEEKQPNIFDQYKNQPWQR